MHQEVASGRLVGRLSGTWAVAASTAPLVDTMREAESPKAVGMSGAGGCEGTNMKTLGFDRSREGNGGYKEGNARVGVVNGSENCDIVRVSKPKSSTEPELPLTR
ncbi:hypothetical protein IW150_005902 [Coemansia sp. RSA 2607]|nr:hypothetical protein IW150_005902 [Coemansia sp. RSA 2607]